MNPENIRDLADSAARRHAAELYAVLNTWGDIIYTGTIDDCQRWYDTQSNIAFVYTIKPLRKVQSADGITLVSLPKQKVQP